MNKYYLAFITIITILLPSLSFARENASGIWIGTMTSPHPPHETAEIYISIHETDELSVVIFLSAVEESGDLLSSTYIGPAIGTIDDILKSYGKNAYFPVNYDAANNKVIYGPYASINIVIREDGTGEGLLAGGLISFPYPVQLRKIVGTK